MRKWVSFLATGFFSGRIPWAPGTMGTLVAIPCYIGLMQCTSLGYAAIVLGATCLGIFLCGRAAHDLGVHDHPSIVWDEMVGFWVMMWGVPFSWKVVLIGFCLFRVFDIWKPWPIGFLDKQVSGGVGIMLDDLLAAVYAAVLLRVFLSF